MPWYHLAFSFDEINHIYWITLEPEEVPMMLLRIFHSVNNPHQFRFIYKQIKHLEEQKSNPYKSSISVKYSPTTCHSRRSICGAVYISFQPIQGWWNLLNFNDLGSFNQLIRYLKHSENQRVWCKIVHSSSIKSIRFFYTMPQRKQSLFCAGSFVLKNCFITYFPNQPKY